MNQNLSRTLEPEVMDDFEEASLYDSMDHRVVNSQFVDDLMAGGAIGVQIIDLGTGTARIPILLGKQSRNLHIMALDAAVHMLDIAARNVDVAGLLDTIQLVHADVKSLTEFDDAICDCVISNTLLHHLPEPIVAIQTSLRLLRPSGRLFIRDLLRPATRDAVEELVFKHAGEETAESQQLLRQSLHAALMLEEARQMAVDCGLASRDVQVTSDRHWTLDTIKS